MKKALVALPDDIWGIIDRDLKGKVGTGDSDTIRAIVISWLAEKGYLTRITHERLTEEGWIKPAKTK